MAYKQGSQPDYGVTASYYDDFLDRRQEWSANIGGSAVINTGTNDSITNPGQAEFVLSGAFASASLELQSFYTVGGGQTTFDFVVKIATLGSATDRISLQIGIMDQFGGFQNGNPNNGLYFQYVDNVNSGAWQCIAISSTVATTTNSAVTADTNFHHYRVQINAAGTSVTYYIDGVLLATHTTNIPTVLIAPTVSMGIGASSGANMISTWDVFSYQQNLTSNRF